MSNKFKQILPNNYYDFFCLNDDCSQRFKWQKWCENEKEITEEPCPKCGEISSYSLVIISGSRPGSFSSKTTQERKEILLKRSKDHFNKNIKEKKLDFHEKIRKQAKDNN